MNKKTTLILLLLTAAFATTKAQMTIGGSYKPSHTLVVKGQVKIDTVKSGTTADNILTIGGDSVLHSLPYSTFVTATSNSLGLSNNILTSTVNGVPATSSVIGGVSNASSTNSLSTTVNGVTGTTVPIINTNTNALTQSGGLVTTVNSVAATTSIPAGTVTNLLGYSSTGAPVYQSASTAVSGATSNSLSLATNTLTSTVNGKATTSSVIGGVSNASSANTLSTTVNGVAGATVPIINTNTNALSRTGGLVTTVNGVAATTAIPSGTITNMLGYNSSDVPVYQTPASVLSSATSHSLGLATNTLTSTVNGVAATSSVVGTVSNTSSANTLSTTVNGVAGATVPIINTNTMSLAGNVLTSNVNGVTATSNAITGLNNYWGQNVGLTTSVNGLSSTVSIPSSTVVNILGYNTLGSPVYQPIVDFYSKNTSTYTTITANNTSFTDANETSQVNKGGGTFDASTGTYTTPVAGVYEVETIVRYNFNQPTNSGAARLYYARLTINGTSYSTSSAIPYNDNTGVVSSGNSYTAYIKEVVSVPANAPIAATGFTYGNGSLFINQFRVEYFHAKKVD